MKKQIRKVFQKLTAPTRNRAARLRALRMESLENRELLAADTSLPFHNPLISEDVDYNFSVTPRDALMIINEINSRGSYDLGDQPDASRSAPAFLDVSGDGVLSPQDALMVINFLNGEGEEPILVSYTATLTNVDGTPLTNNQVVVGSSFKLNVFVQDTRPAGPTGVFQNAIDVGVTGFDKLTYPTGSSTFLGGLTFGSFYPNGHTGTAGAAGNEGTEFFNEIGAFAGFTPPNPTGDTLLFFSATIKADTAGTVSFILNKHDDEPRSQVLVYDSTGTLPDNGRIDPISISYETEVLTIIADPTAPVAVADSVSTAEDTSLILAGSGATVNLLSNDNITNTPASVVAVNSIAGTTQGTISGLTYSPPANFFGTDFVTYTIQDNKGLQSTATVTITVTAVNDAPIANDDVVSVDEETTNNSLLLLQNDSPGPNETDALTITQVSATTNGGTVTIATGGGSVLYTPPTGFIGQDTFTYTMRDAGGLTDSATVTVNVEATVLPRGRADAATVAEDSADNSIDVLANDRVNTGATAILLSLGPNPANGTISINDNGTPNDKTDDKVSYTPNANFFGTDTFTYQMNDTAGTGADSVGTVVVTVTAINDAPILQGDTADGTEDNPVTIAISSLLANDSPGAGETATQSLTLTSVSAVGSGAAVAISGANVVVTPNADFNGTFLFTYSAADNGSPVLSSTATVTVNIAAVNDAPIGNADTGSTNEDNSLSLSAASLLANDQPGPTTATDEAGQVLTLTGVSPTSTAGGTVSFDGTTVSYTPPTDFNGSDTFTYTLRDEAEGTATATVTITVNPINDAPIAGQDTVRAFKNFPTTVSAASLLANDSPGPANEASQTLSIVAVIAGANTHGQVTLNGDGTITYTPDADYTGPASFQYRLQDSGSGVSPNVNETVGSVNVTVEEFVPSAVSGKVFVDENRNGVQDGSERSLGGVQVTLTGNSLGQAITPQSYLTLADGSYHFDNLGPGQYIVSMGAPAGMIAGTDTAGTLGDKDNVDNQFTIDIAQPGGFDASGYNFIVIGMEATSVRLLDQLASRYYSKNPTLQFNGMYFALDANNQLLWNAVMDGFDEAVFAEAVLNSTGSELYLTVVDSAHGVQTSTLRTGQFVTQTRADGTRLIRVLGDETSMSWQSVNLQAPPVAPAANYLHAVDAIFAQEEWN
ncbi:MAG: tandem-95 repeat protein [Planctomycetales bacterium]|nr:tandem-95 repeat protein [Planctomycetales bacterium]